MISSKSVLPVVSGGVDSTTLLWYLMDKGYNVVEMITFDYGQRHRVEIQAASNICEAFCRNFNLQVVHKIVDLWAVTPLIAQGAITGDEKMPHAMYDNETQRKTIVPNRNMIFLSIAGGRAVTIEARYIAYAAHASDYAVYPDCRPEFIEQLSNALYLGNEGTPVSIFAPFSSKSKIDIVSIGLNLEVPYELTWSCYEGKERACLACGTCLERTEAFMRNSYPDPALTGEEWENALEIYQKMQKQHEGDMIERGNA